MEFIPLDGKSGIFHPDDIFENHLEVERISQLIQKDNDIHASRGTFVCSYRVDSNTLDVIMLIYTLDGNKVCNPEGLSKYDSVYREKTKGHHLHVRPNFPSTC